MARFRGALKYEVDWLGDGLYSHGLADVTQAVDGDFTALFGAAKASNPDRPILRPLVGHVTLMGANYAPRSSPVFTPPNCASAAYSACHGRTERTPSTFAPAGFRAEASGAARRHQANAVQS